jgi:tetratricopeptide (TPR) repeat protein
MCTFFALAGALNEDESKSAVGAKHQQSKWNMTTSYGFVVLLMLTVIYLIASGIRRTHSESEYATASLATRQGDYEGALQHIAVAEYNSDCDALYASMEGFNYQRSVDEGQQFNDLWHRNIILTHRRREGLEKAASAYQRASACAPMDAGIHHTLGWLYTMLGDDRQAREQVNESLRLEPNTALYHLSSGLLNERKGNTNAAYAEYSEAIALSPRILDSDFFIQLKLRHPDKISDIIDRSKNVVEQFANTPMRQAALAKLYYQVNDYTSAKSALHNALMELPTLSNAWVTQGKIDEDEGDIYKAVMDYRRALFVDSINRVAWAGLAEVYEVTDNNQKGLHAARMAVMSEEPSEHSLRSSRMYHMNTISSDDLIPFGILDYARPRIDIDHLYKIINEMTERGGVEVP